MSETLAGFFGFLVLCLVFGIFAAIIYDANKKYGNKEEDSQQQHESSKYTEPMLSHNTHDEPCRHDDYGHNPASGLSMSSSGHDRAGNTIGSSTTSSTRHY